MCTETRTDGVIDVLGISGSLRAGSYNTTLLRGAVALADPSMRLGLWHGLGDVPPFNADHEDRPPRAVRTMRTEIDDADAVLISTPEYNTTVPGQLKNAIDWASRPQDHSVLLGKPVAVVGASPSDYGAAWSQAAVRKAVASCGARVVDKELCVARADEAFGPDDQLRDPTQKATLAELLGDLGDAARHTAVTMAGATR